MVSLLQVVVTFVGVMLVLAMVAQSLQEAVKSTGALKSGLRFKAVRALIIESAIAEGLTDKDAEDIVQALIDRLASLGQPAVRRKKSLRLDVIDANKLEQLVSELPPDKVGSLKTVAEKAERKKKMEAIGGRAKNWFDLSVAPVTDRHARRMKVAALITGGLVVLAVNADAFWIIEHARTDADFRANVATQVDSLNAHEDIVTALQDSIDADSTGSDSLFNVLSAQRDSVAGRSVAGFQAALAAASGLFPGYRGWSFKFRWLLGILISTLLVGMGAPFWNDLLGSLMGVKDRVQADARVRRGSAP